MMRECVSVVCDMSLIVGFCCSSGQPSSPSSITFFFVRHVPKHFSLLHSHNNQSHRHQSILDIWYYLSEQHKYIPPILLLVINILDTFSNIHSYIFSRIVGIVSVFSSLEVNHSFLVAFHLFCGLVAFSCVIRLPAHTSAEGEAHSQRREKEKEEQIHVSPD